MAFSNCKQLVSVLFNANLREIYRSAFYGCDALKRVILPAELAAVGRTAF